MPVSHIGLIVSHLPTSCSFFLEALSPLGYRYIGQQGNQIGFGVQTADFFICQQTAEYKAGAAHVAFTAASRSVVDAFFSAALKAGGRSHGAPAVRDQETGYYSAAVLDFDGNSIEVTSREKKTEIPESSTMGSSEGSRVLEWQKDVAKSTAGHRAEGARSTARITVNNVSRPTVVVSHSQSALKSSGDMSTKALIGTILGAAAGAAVAYAMTKGEAESSYASGSTSLVYPAIQAATLPPARSVVISRHSYPPPDGSHASRTVIQEIDYPPFADSRADRSTQSPRVASIRSSPRAVEAPPLAISRSTLIDTFIAPSEVPRYPPPLITRSNTDGMIRSSPSSKASATSHHPHSKASRASSAAKTITQADLMPSIRSSHSSKLTELRIARDLPLPPSCRTSAIPSRSQSPRDLVLGEEEVGSVACSVAPSDSISQAGSKKSKGSKRSSRLTGSVLEERSRKVDHDMTRRRESAISLPMRPASKASVHRSVTSFLPGM